MRIRRGISLIELLIAVGILALLVGLLLAAVQRVRLAAYRVQSANNLRQIALGVQQLADKENGVIKNLLPNNVPCLQQPGGGWFASVPYTSRCIFMDILPWTYGDVPRMPPNPTPEQREEFSLSPIVPCYVSPADPTLFDRAALDMDGRSACSYSYNAQALRDTVSLPASISDGMSNTISFTERYAHCRIQGFRELQNWDLGSPPHGPAPYRTIRRASFADPSAYDIYPILDFAGHTVASQPGRTFQVRPRLDQSDGKLPQTPYEGGLLVSFFDGSVRTIRAGVSESSFWGMVTPAGGEVIIDD